MSDDQDFNLGQQIAQLRGEVNVGFTGVNRRLDILNGKVAEHEKKLTNNDVVAANKDGKMSTWVFLGSHVVSVVIALIIFVVTNKYLK